MMKVEVYARVSTHDQQTLPLQLKAMRQYARKRGWKIVQQARRSVRAPASVLSERR